MMTDVVAQVAFTRSAAHESALKMAEVGFWVFPLWGTNQGICACPDGAKCKSPGKHPRRMAAVKDATLNPTVIDSWFAEAGLNYGVVMGKAIKGGKKIVVIDIDDYKDVGTGPLDQLTAKYGPLTDTAEVITGRDGRHLYYLAPMDAEFVGKLGANIDFKVNGYVVGPGSMHASGKRYEWEGSSDLFEGHLIADLPQWVIDHFSKSAQVTEAVVTVSVTEPLSDYEIQRLHRALHHIPSDDYDIWVKVLMGLKSIGDDKNAFAIADEWSKRSDNYKQGDTQTKWHQLSKNGGITLGTIYKMSQDYCNAGAAEVDLTRFMINMNKVWANAEPLNITVSAEPYPLESLPLVVRDAVVEVQQFVQAPVAMVACSALATLSLAAQSQYDVERASSLSGPLGLYFLVVADSGERKSTLDAYFAKPVAQYEQDQAKAAEPLLSDYAANMAAWEAGKQGLSDRIKLFTKDGKNIDATKDQLRAHEADKPTRPQVARLVYSDTTPEALVRGIATEWPSVGLISSEGGAVFGGHGMKSDAQMRNMATINQLWDGKPTRTDRSTSSSFTAEGRLTVAIQVQAPTLKAFFEASGGLARGTGFLARFLVAWPESTQGTRMFIEPPAQWPMLEHFRARVTEILNLPQPIEQGRLQPPMLYLAPDAKRVWVDFYNELEQQLGFGGDLHDVRDVASKTADNAARMAGLFHVMEGACGSISANHMQGATNIMRWHLNESQRVLGGAMVPSETAAAAKLDQWLLMKCREKGMAEFTVQEVMQLGPKSMRKKEVLEPLLMALAALARIRVVGDSPRVVHVNPALLD